MFALFVNYRRDGYPNGSAWPPLQYFFWKACYGMGAMEAAREICDRYLDLFERNHKETLCVWEQFRAESGQGAGNMRFSGFVTPVVAMWKARRISGSVQTGYDVIVRAVKISSGNAELQLESPFYSGNTGISIVLSPDCGYTVRQNDKIIGNVKSDRFGWLGIAFKIDSGVGTRLNIKADAQ